MLMMLRTPRCHSKTMGVTWFSAPQNACLRTTCQADSMPEDSITFVSQADRIAERLLGATRIFHVKCAMKVGSDHHTNIHHAARGICKFTDGNRVHILKILEYCTRVVQSTLRSIGFQLSNRCLLTADVATATVAGEQLTVMCQPLQVD